MRMIEKIEQIKEQMAAFKASSAKDVEEFKRIFTAKNGLITALFEEFKALPGEQKRAVGALLNELKARGNGYLTTLSAQLAHRSEKQSIDYTLPGYNLTIAKAHPLNTVRNEMIGIFERIGFIPTQGPEIEDDWHNFTALNFPPEHPARDMQDTFFVSAESGMLLRTHTSGVQVHTMLNEPPPLRIISFGRVYRCDSDATHSPVFHQVEGLYVDKNVSFSDLKDVLFYFVRSFFGNDIKVRFRPSYFPFTEPSAEMDIGWNVDGKFKWMEILGCGMVDPHVLENCGIDSTVYSGYAFGIGVERLTMLKHKIKDIRLFYQNDHRFLSQL